MIDELRGLLRARDAYALAERIQSGRDARAAAERYAELVRDLYWKAKDVAAAVAVGRAGIYFALGKAIDIAGHDPDAALALRGVAKQMAYNVASFAWPGWNEPGVTIADADRLAGYDAARLNLRLAVELKRDASKTSMAHWMLAAHHLSGGAAQLAVESFGQAKADAERAGEAAQALMCDGYAALAQSVATPDDDVAARDRFERAVSRLRQLGNEDATLFADQLGTVRAYFLRSS
jgi:hypothetical protein